LEAPKYIEGLKLFLGFDINNLCFPALPFSDPVIDVLIRTNGKRERRKTGITFSFPFYLFLFLSVVFIINRKP